MNNFSGIVFLQWYNGINIEIKNLWYLLFLCDTAC